MVSFWKRWNLSFVFGGASKWVPSLGSRFGARHRKHTIYKQLNLLFLLFLNWNSLLVLISQIKVKKCSIKSFSILWKSDFFCWGKYFQTQVWLTNKICCFFWEFHWFEFTSKHFKNLLDLYFILNLEKKDVYLRFRAENFWVKPRFWQWLPAEHE